MVPAGATVAVARRAIAAALRAARLDTPELDARLLVGEALGLDHAGLAVVAARVLSADEARRIEALARRRLAHEPVARILGRSEFWSLPLRVTPDVLDPRPDTETVVRAALAVIDARGPRRAVARLADLGTGSGAILLALLSELPEARGVGTDTSLAALGVARDNAGRLGLASRAGFVACDYGGALAGGFDLVVSNPPYIRTADIATLAPEVRDFDPRPALDGGPDGLDAYRAIAADAGRLLAPGGLIVVEVGHDQSESVVALFDTAGFAGIGDPYQDFSGHRRAVLAQRQT